jgi:uncharacterized protein
MSMLDTLKARLTECRKAGRAVEMTVLQVVLGDASTIEARSGKKATDDEVEKIVRKTMLGNQETLGILEQKGLAGSANHAKLTAENAFLQTLLPDTLSVEEIVAQLQEVADAIRAAKNDGQATGAAMKHLKPKGLRVLGDDVSAAVKKIRGG